MHQEPMPDDLDFSWSKDPELAKSAGIPLLKAIQEALKHDPKKMRAYLKASLEDKTTLARIVREMLFDLLRVFRAPVIIDVENEAEHIATDVLAFLEKGISDNK